MVQNYTEQLRKDNVRDAIYEDLQNNCEVLRTSWSGNDFPANPKVGQPCYRVDEDKLYYWDGYRWSQKGGGGSAELKSMELPAITTERVSIALVGARCLNKDMMFVFVDKIAQDPSTYSMNDDGSVVNFNPAIPPNAAVTLRWFDTDVGTFDTAVFATSSEFQAGTATDKAPTVKQVRSGLVTTDTAQNINAGKNFINNTSSTNVDAHTNMSICLKNSQADLTANTMNADGTVNFKYQGIRTVDKNNAEISYLYSAPDGVGGSFTRLGASTKVGGQYADAFIDIEVDANGKGHLYIPDVDTASGVSGNQAATKEYVDARDIVSKNTAVPTGTIITWSTATPPAGYLICDGSAISRTTYANLFAVIGTTYGEGDGNTTFNLPNCHNHTLWQGGTVGTSFTGSLPNITGTIQLAKQEWRSVSGAFTLTGDTDTKRFAANGADRTGNWAQATFNAKNSSPVYNRTDNLVVPSGINIKFCIKY